MPWPAIWACQAGKDVYVEKPASHNMFESVKMVEGRPQVQAHGPGGLAKPLGPRTR